jgi:hypothetical protein
MEVGHWDKQALRTSEDFTACILYNTRTAQKREKGLAKTPAKRPILTLMSDCGRASWKQTFAGNRRAANPQRAHHFHKIDPMPLKQKQCGWDAELRRASRKARHERPAVILFFVPNDEAPLILNG